LYIKKRSKKLVFNYTFWGPPFANFGATFNWEPGANCPVCPPPCVLPCHQYTSDGNSYTGSESDDSANPDDHSNIQRSEQQSQPNLMNIDMPYCHNSAFDGKNPFSS
jgi:hypothetical protein